MCVPLALTPLTKFKHFKPPLVNSLLSLNSFVSSAHESTQLLIYGPVKKCRSGYCKDSEQAQGPKRDLAQTLRLLTELVNPQLTELGVSKLFSLI